MPIGYLYSVVCDNHYDGFIFPDTGGLPKIKIFNTWLEKDTAVEEVKKALKRNGYDPYFVLIEFQSCEPSGPNIRI